MRLAVHRLRDRQRAGESTLGIGEAIRMEVERSQTQQDRGRFRCVGVLTLGLSKLGEEFGFGGWHGDGGDYPWRKAMECSG